MATRALAKARSHRKLFVLSAGAVLSLTGAAKLCSAFGSARILAISDPLLGLHFRHLMFLVGVLELVIASACFFDKSSERGLVLVSWLTTNVFAYRLALREIGWHRPCHCLGNVTDAIHVSPQLADSVTKGALAYLLIGSYTLLFFLWRRNRLASLAASSNRTFVRTS